MLMVKPVIEKAETCEVISELDEVVLVLVDRKIITLRLHRIQAFCIASNYLAVPSP